MKNASTNDWLSGLSGYQSSCSSGIASSVSSSDGSVLVDCNNCLPWLDDPIYIPKSELVQLAIRAVPNMLGAYVSSCAQASKSMDSWLPAFYHLTRCASVLNQSNDSVYGKCLYTTSHPQDLILVLLFVLYLQVIDPGQQAAGQFKGLIITPDSDDIDGDTRTNNATDYKNGFFVIDSRSLACDPGSDNMQLQASRTLLDMFRSISNIHWELIMRNADNFFEDLFLHQDSKKKVHEKYEFKDFHTFQQKSAAQVSSIRDDLFAYLVQAALSKCF